MQLTRRVCCSGISSCSSSLRRLEACRLPQPQHNNSRQSASLLCSAAGGLRSREQEVATASASATQAAGLQQQAYSSATPAPTQEQQQPQQQLPSEIKRVLFAEHQIRAKVAELAAQICRDYEGKPLAIIGVLNGAYIFTADLAREVSKEMPNVKVDFMRASSYGAASESNGAVTVKEVSDLTKWDKYNILLVEDIIDSGHTLARLSGVLKDAGADTVKVVALLDKKGRRRVEFFPDYVGWECPNEFVVGYGLDFNECYRCLPYVAALKEEAYAGSGH